MEMAGAGDTLAALERARVMAGSGNDGDDLEGEEDKAATIAGLL